MGDITTGIDKLVQLINRRNEISLEEAAKELNVDKAVLEDWVEVLEAEKLVKVNYKFSNMFISGSKTTTKDALKTAAHVVSQKEAFNRKIDATLHALDKETEGFDQVRTEFISIQKHIKGELKTVRHELDELKQFEHLKNNIDKDIIASKKDFQKFVSLYNGQLDEFDKKYVSLVNDLKAEQIRLEKYAKKVDELKRAKTDIEKTVHDSLDELRKVTREFEGESKNISVSEKRIAELNHSITHLSSNIQDKKAEALKQLNKKIGTSLHEIESKQDELLASAKVKKDEIQNYAHAGNMIYKSFSKLFSDKIKTAEMIEDIQKEREGLIKELTDLKTKVTIFSIKQKDPAIKEKLKEMEKVIEDYEKRKHSLATRIDKLMSFIRNH
ncbi:MAG: hypothetical protein KC535_03250 [Nanoarchaeota archaeon]|nr:hypothetical protein [Nanoarchaeota archaeon]